ncbi:hypothetical protein J4N45_19575 [Vibrio sp. SCSIO 43140]|uniref:hypothetical protein n=1 Tax=Vibrio sp. SCSIO 43140 TaxID=2819100 RepID=UPI0020765B79|nr:hypothetical protein [Vibrio sp. SCSIO 43140]USD63199.1 hypothetical protein J4N45_19575 [Vibrio sp. SCSIO 43140]
MKLKTLSTLIAVALTAGTLSGCNFYDEPPGGETPEEPGGGNPPIEGVDIIVENAAELAAAIAAAKEGEIIGLKEGGDYASMGTVVLEKPLTLTSVTADGDLSEDGENQAVISGATCIDVPTTADQVLKGTTGITLHNIKFQGVELSTCGTEDTSRSIINIGKVGDGNTPVYLKNLTFDGASFAESTSAPTAWIYSRGLVNVSESEFSNKTVANTATGILYLNCGSNRINGGSARLGNPTFENNSVALVANSANISGVVAGQFDPTKQCAAKITNNSFAGFAIEETALEDTIAAVIDGDASGANIISDNTYTDVGSPPPTDPDNDVEALNEAIAAASVGDVIKLKADGDYSAGMITLNKAVTLDGEREATINGSACITVTVPGASVIGVNFNNSAIGAECSAEDSDGRRGAITIEKGASDKDEPVVLKSLHFDSSLITEEGLYKKASWVYSAGHVHISESIFDNLKSNIQNNAFYTPCNDNANKLGIRLINNEFYIDDSGDKETAAIKVGNSSRGEQTAVGCNVYIQGNTFDGYYQDLSSLSGSGKERIVSIFATDDAVTSENANVRTDNTFFLNDLN